MQTTSGGMALLYYASQRIDVRRKEVLQGETKDSPARGIKIRAKVVKNKVAPPHGQALFDLYFDSGLDRTASMIDGAVAYGVLEKRGAFYYLTDAVTDDADAAEKSFAQVRLRRCACPPVPCGVCTLELNLSCLPCTRVCAGCRRRPEMRADLGWGRRPEVQRDSARGGLDRGLVLYDRTVPPWVARHFYVISSAVDSQPVS